MFCIIIIYKLIYKEGLLGVNLIENEYFHSHLESLRNLDENSLKDQVIIFLFYFFPIFLLIVIKFELLKITFSYGMAQNNFIHIKNNLNPIMDPTR